MPNELPTPSRPEPSPPGAAGDAQPRPPSPERSGQQPAGEHGAPATHAPTIEPRAPLAVKLLAAFAIIGFGVILGGRVRSALVEKEALARTRDETAATAASSGNEPARAPVVRPVPDRWSASVQIEGTLLPWHEADLAFKAGGRLASVRVKLGDTVKQGQTLASLDAAEASSSARAAAAQVRVAEAQLALAADSEQRTTQMVDAGAVGEAAGVQATGQRTLVIAQLEGARAQLAVARAAVANHHLVAPFAGLITRAPTGPGAVVGGGMPLVHLVDSTRLRLSATVGEADAILLSPGAPVEIRAGSRVVKGTLTTVLRTVDPATRRVPVEAEIVNPADAPLLANSFVRATLGGGEAVPVLRLPATARRPGSQDEVMVVSGGKLHTRKILFVLAPDGALLVRSGVSEPLTEHDDVLERPSAESRDGDLVTAVASASQTTPPGQAQPAPQPAGSAKGRP
jgi:RND family efflux transporter MFP subunit